LLRPIYYQSLDRKFTNQKYRKCPLLRKPCSCAASLLSYSLFSFSNIKTHPSTLFIKTCAQTWFHTSLLTPAGAGRDLVPELPHHRDVQSRPLCRTKASPVWSRYAHLKAEPDPVWPAGYRSFYRQRDSPR